MNHDDKLKDFLRKNDSVDYKAPVDEFEKIYNKSQQKSWIYYFVPTMAAAVLVMFVVFGRGPSTVPIASDDSLEDFLSETMEYSMADSYADVGGDYLLLIEE